MGMRETGTMSPPRPLGCAKNYFRQHPGTGAKVCAVLFIVVISYDHTLVLLGRLVHWHIDLCLPLVKRWGEIERKSYASKLGFLVYPMPSTNKSLDIVSSSSLVSRSNLDFLPHSTTL